ncbi:DUF58 domain-containing protein [Flavobacterium oreochromis]|uniref:VWFA domain-containing protein n=2 Tax=Flavobacterium TaxID=237 RepID=A0A246GCU8_9FLAO|nr:DUF58 domain-containing protein [Flavobacterium oreochromis]OWP78717.1 hypothetical protein BWG23_01130 [Flavobacterium oreochromis]OWP78956.1 hypothetical protein BWK62_04110 [Flavobacterium oreochromis]POR29501.1 hypothetical protein BWK58_02225 [Flavobacterium columnare]QYS87491.1 DUF58 domain-containing protein [Flavobacterium oreochromis]
METKDLLKKVRKIEIKTRRLSDHIFSGEYHTSFKGRGMTFSEVRQYQYGDDVRAIDWNVTARYKEPYVKVFEEERELTMMLMVDISGSESFGTKNQLKSEIVTEIAATLAFSATQNNDKIGLILFSDQIELYIPPKKGKSHVLRIIRELIEFEAKSKQTNVGKALEFLSATQKKKAIVFMISDFITDDNYEKTLKIASKKHDITGIRVFDIREEKIPDVGLVAMQDAETDAIQWINTSSKNVRLQYEKYYQEKVSYFKDVFSKCGAGTVHTRVDESYVKKLLGYFKSR